jgi:hypothetical protein
MKRKARGVLITLDPALAFPHEIDTFTCCHCSKVVDKPPYMQPTDTNKKGVPLGGYCHRCDAHTCPECAGKPCTPAERLLELVEKGRHYDELLGRK